MLIQGPEIAEPLIVEIVRAALAAGAIPHVRASVQGVDEAYLAAAGDAQLDHLPAYALEEMDAIDARIAIHAAWNTRELSGHRPRQARPPLARRPAGDGPLHGALGRGRPALVRDRVPVRRVRPGRRHVARRLRRLHLPRRLAAPGRPGGRVARLRGQAATPGRPHRPGAHAAGPGRGHRPARSASPAAPGSPRAASATSPTARSSPGRSRPRPSGDVRFSFPAVMGGREVQDVRLRFEDGRVVKAEAGRRRRLPRPDARDGRRRVGARRVRDRHELHGHPVHEADPVRREDRRHVPHGARRRLSRHRQRQPLGPALGHGVRPARRRRDPRRRRADLPRRRVPALVLRRRPRRAAA